jgi:hypothetical protein
MVGLLVLDTGRERKEADARETPPRHRRHNILKSPKQAGNKWCQRPRDASARSLPGGRSRGERNVEEHPLT